MNEKMNDFSKIKWSESNFLNKWFLDLYIKALNIPFMSYVYGEKSSFYQASSQGYGAYRLGEGRVGGKYLTD